MEENILEEIVGEIDDETDIKVKGVKPQPDGSFIVDGSVTIRDLNRSLSWSLSDQNANTIAGLVLYESKTIPEPGQEFRFFDIRFRILQKKGNFILFWRNGISNGISDNFVEKASELNLKIETAEQNRNFAADK